MNRKEFIRNTGMAAAFVAIPGKNLFAWNLEAKIKLGIIGVGLRGQGHLNLLLRRDDVDLVGAGPVVSALRPGLPRQRPCGR